MPEIHFKTKKVLKGKEVKLKKEKFKKLGLVVVEKLRYLLLRSIQWVRF